MAVSVSVPRDIAVNRTDRGQHCLPWVHTEADGCHTTKYKTVAATVESATKEMVVR